MQGREHVAKLVIPRQLQYDVAGQLRRVVGPGVRRIALTCCWASTSFSRSLLRGSSERLILILHMAMSWPSKSESRMFTKMPRTRC